jgi:ABC-2 type transport system permease protein
VKKLLLIAQREFAATVATKAFALGILGTPILMGLFIFVMPRMMKTDAPKIAGDVCLIDATGELADGLQVYLKPEEIAQRRQASSRKMQEEMPAAVKQVAGQNPMGKVAMDQALEKALGEVPRLRVMALDAGANLEAAKAPLKDPVSKDQPETQRIAVIVVHPDALVRADGKEQFGTYDLYIRGKLDDRVVDEITSGMREALVAARIRKSGLDRAQIDAMTHVERVTSREVTATGESTSNRVLNLMLPMAFMGLLLMSTLMTGSYLLTSTVEEKSNRVVEVLLSAVSPMELMAGKILGQLCVGLLVLSVYMGLGLMALLSFTMLGMLDPWLIVYLFAFFLTAYVTIGALMAAIGSAVNEMREAQGLMMPVTLIVMIPWILWLPISRDPNSVVATVLSFLPPVGSFVMMLRLASATPPPWWQAVLGFVTAAAGAYAALWFAAKVFRIGLLMFGKPPSFAVLVKWARQA